MASVLGLALLGFLQLLPARMVGQQQQQEEEGAQRVKVVLWVGRAVEQGVWAQVQVLPRVRCGLLLSWVQP